MSERPRAHSEEARASVGAQSSVPETRSEVKAEAEPIAKPIAKPNSKPSSKSSSPQLQAQSQDGLVSFLLSLLGLFFFWPVCIAGLIVSRKEKERAAAENLRPSILTEAGGIIGIIGTIMLAIVVVIICMILFAVGIAGS